MTEDLQSKASEFVKKVITVGIGAAFLTEESLRSLMSEFKLPKELFSGLLESANKTKNEFFQRLSTDIMEKLTPKLDLKELISEVLEKHELDFEVKLKFTPKK
ncbi:MAG: hypothetical protein HY072_00625 [Deltaproteobacteria bacterium]|nr:hypothetical protein [Deltaproteobacteria bacterium]